MNGLDGAFMKKCGEIFEINPWHDGDDGRMLRRWVGECIADIVSYFSINPQTMYGTLNLGPDPNTFRDIFPDHKNPSEISRRFSERQREDFDIAYKVLATNVCAVLSDKLEPYINEAIEEGYEDIVCSVEKYRIGMVIIQVRADFEIQS